MDKEEVIEEFKEVTQPKKKSKYLVVIILYIIVIILTFLFILGINHQKNVIEENYVGVYETTK